MSIYYDYSKILSYNAEMNIICAMRGNGKTYGVKKYVLDRYFKYKEQFVYVRRTDIEMMKTKKKFLTDIGHIYSEYGILKVNGDELQLFKEEEKDPLTVGYFMSLNCYEKYKSGSYQEVTTMIYDEFMSKNGYLKNELFNFSDLHETIFRDRSKAKCFLISNTMSTVSPYFETFGIQVKNGFKGIIKNKIKDENGIYTVVADFPESIEYKNHKKTTPSGMLAKITGYSSYSLDGNFMLDDSRNVNDKINKSKLEFRYNLILNNLFIGVYLYNNLYYFGDPIENGRVYATTAEEVSKYGAMFVSKQWSNFKNYERNFKNDSMLFKNIKIKNEIILLMRKLIKGF